MTSPLLRPWLPFPAGFPSRAGAASRRPRGPRRPQAAAAERLEDRLLLTAYVVNTLSDLAAFDGKVSLREAIDASNTNAPVNEAVAGQGGGAVDSITFAPALAGGTITLDGSQLTISGDLTVTGLGANRLTVSGNGASRVFDVAANVTARIRSLAITRGSVPDVHGVEGAGGGIRNAGTLTVTDCAIVGNSAWAGGGIAGREAYTTVVGCLIAGNSADRATGGFGGGIDYGGVGDLTVINSTVSGNYGRQGGGIRVSTDTYARLVNVTVFGNRSNEGGGIFYTEDAEVYMDNSLVAGNTVDGLPEDILYYSRGRFISGGHNLVGDAGSAGGLRNGRNGNVTGVDWRTVLDPALRDNGGATLTHKLLTGGKAVDAGDDAQADGPAGQPLTTDQRGGAFGRILGARVDIGAFESAPAADLVGYLGGTWWVAASTGTAFSTSVWGDWAGFAWDALGQADFTGDGKADTYGLVDGAWWVGPGTGSAFSQPVRWTLWSNLDWQDVKTADLDGDGKADVLARAGGNWWAALSTGAAFAAPTLWASWAMLDWREFFAADLTGDGKADLLGYARGQWWAGVSTGAAFAGPYLWGAWSDAAWRTLQVGDFDGDGRSDAAGLVGGDWWVGRTVATEFETSFQTRLWARWSNVAWSDPLTADFDGDGRGDVAARHGGTWWVSLSAGSEYATAKLWASWSNVAWKDVRSADFDGDGRDDIAGRHNGQWWVARGTGAGSATSLWGTWSEANWRAVGAVHVGDPPAAASASGSGASFSARAQSPRPPLGAADDEPLRLFWRQADEDEEFTGRLAAG